ncbi:MAG TPA: NAD(P)-dependent oxidoreductase [Anaerolineales bacterium]|nr:NAD(P)-dependent oxidoreductase [Anaerolineales bacterium]
MIKNVSLIGLGSMGIGIAHNILKAGFDLTVHNRTAAKAEPLAKLGAKVAASPAEAARDADLVISIVADDAASRQVWLGETGALSSAGREAIMVESSTLSHTWVRELASLTAERELAFLDAPVNGGPSVAAAGQLKMMVGGEAEILDRARPVLVSFTEQLTHMGPNGTGTMTKLVNNLMSGVQMVALAEALYMAERAGLNLEQVVPVITSSGPASPLIKRNAPLMAARNYGEPNFLLRHIRKDVTYALRLAEELDAPLTTASAAREAYRMAGKLGYDNAEFAAIFEALHTDLLHKS